MGLGSHINGNKLIPHISSSSRRIDQINLGKCDNVTLMNENILNFINNLYISIIL